MSVIYFIGQDVPITATVLNDSGQATTPTSISVTVKDPSGNPVTASTPAQGATGVYTAVVSSVSVAGTYTVRWVASGTGFNWSFEDQFTVRPQSVLQIVDLASVKTQLNMSNDSSQDAELEGFITAATELIRDITGPIFQEQHTEWFTGGSRSLMVDWTPLQSIQSITEYYGLSAFAITEQALGSQTNAFGFTADYGTGEITRRTFGGAPALWAVGYKNVKVVYTAGLASIPFAVRLAALRLIQHWWSQFKQARPRPGGRGMDGEESTPMGYAVPDAVVELLAPWRRPPGVA